MTLRYTSRAADQIEEALDFVARDSPRAADRIRDRLQATTGLLVAYPRAGTATSRSGVFRIFLTPFPYSIDYRVIDGNIVVQRFRHTSRRPI